MSPLCRLTHLHLFPATFSVSSYSPEMVVSPPRNTFFGPGSPLSVFPSFLDVVPKFQTLCSSSSALGFLGSLLSPGNGSLRATPWQFFIVFFPSRHFAPPTLAGRVGLGPSTLLEVRPFLNHGCRDSRICPPQVLFSLIRRRPRLPAVLRFRPDFLPPPPLPAGCTPAIFLCSAKAGHLFFPISSILHGLRFLRGFPPPASDPRSRGVDTSWWRPLHDRSQSSPRDLKGLLPRRWENAARFVPPIGYPIRLQARHHFSILLCRSFLTRSHFSCLFVDSRPCSFWVPMPVDVILDSFFFFRHFKRRSLIPPGEGLAAHVWLCFGSGPPPFSLGAFPDGFGRLSGFFWFSQSFFFFFLAPPFCHQDGFPHTSFTGPHPPPAGGGCVPPPNCDFSSLISGSPRVSWAF